MIDVENVRLLSLCNCTYAGFPQVTPQVVVFIHAKDAWCIMIREVLIHFGDSSVESWISHAGVVCSVYCPLSECLWVGVANLFRVLGAWEMIMEAMNSFTTFWHKHLPAFSGHLHPREAHPWPLGLRMPTLEGDLPVIVPFFSVPVNTGLKEAVSKS